MTQRDTRTPPVLNTIYDQITNRTVTYNEFVWRSSPPAGPKQEQTPTFKGVVTSSHLDIQLPYREQELLASLTQHTLELEEEKQHRLRTQRIYSEFLDSQNSLRRQLEVSRTREGELQADLLAAEEAEHVAHAIGILQAERARDPGVFDASVHRMHQQVMTALAEMVAREDPGGHCGLCKGSCVKASLPRVGLRLSDVRGASLRRYLQTLDEIGVPGESSLGWMAQLPV